MTPLLHQIYTNESLEREAREALVAADLSAKMARWREQGPPPTGRFWWLLAILVLVLGTGTWWFWPKAGADQPTLQEKPADSPATQP